MHHDSKAAVKQDSHGRWFFQLRCGNGSPIYNSTTYASKSEAIAIRKAHIHAVMIYKYADIKYQFGSGGGWSWCLPDGHGGTVYQSPNYQTQQEAAHAREVHLRAARFAVYATEDDTCSGSA